MALRHGAPASLFATAPRPSSSRWRSAAAPWPAPALASSSTSAPGQSSRRPASNKPHSAEKSTPVWLAIWRTWAGFANSQLLRANFPALTHIYEPIPVTATLSSCSDKANLSTHLHRLPTPPPYLRRMRLLPGRGAGVGCKMRLSPGCVRGCWVLDEAVASQGRRCWLANNAASCPWHSSCKSPRARILVLGTSGAHWPARWPQFVLTERVGKS